MNVLLFTHQAPAAAGPAVATIVSSDILPPFDHHKWDLVRLPTGEEGRLVVRLGAIGQALVVRARGAEWLASDIVEPSRRERAAAELHAFLTGLPGAAA